MPGVRSGAGDGAREYEEEEHAAPVAQTSVNDVPGLEVLGASQGSIAPTSQAETFSGGEQECDQPPLDDENSSVSQS